MESLDVERETIVRLHEMVSLTRIQWISPIAAMMLIEAGYNNAQKVAAADPEKMCSELDKVNNENSFFKGNIGLRDIKRLVLAASYIED